MLDAPAGAKLEDGYTTERLDVLSRGSAGVGWTAEEGARVLGNFHQGTLQAADIPPSRVPASEGQQRMREWWGPEWTKFRDGALIAAQARGVREVFIEKGYADHPEAVNCFYTLFLHDQIDDIMWNPRNRRHRAYRARGGAAHEEAVRHVAWLHELAGQG
jgi:hypothetical protein